ncbi:MAG: RNA 2',3'-cyclic phosphodiesterase [Bacteroidales bacterium]|nr:MAG: RNA 2',3'-cyclic phosphodiesterase [Bacteroidales bacterium]
METLRTFIAIDVKVEPTLKKKWEELKILLCNDSIKWVNEQTIHLTLSFLGDTPICQIEDITQQLELNLKKTSTFRITLNGFGFFGKSSSPKVIWVGISESQHISQLKKIVNSTLSTLGFDDSQGKFSPHITLGRVKQLKSSIELVTISTRTNQRLYKMPK